MPRAPRSAPKRASSIAASRASCTAPRLAWSASGQPEAAGLPSFMSRLVARGAESRDKNEGRTQVVGGVVGGSVGGGSVASGAVVVVVGASVVVVVVGGSVVVVVVVV